MRMVADKTVLIGVLISAVNGFGAIVVLSK